MFIHIVALLDGANVQKISISGKFMTLKTQSFTIISLSFLRNLQWGVKPTSPNDSRPPPDSSSPQTECATREKGHKAAHSESEEASMEHLIIDSKYTEIWLPTR
jgi:hypothetical protein